MVSTPGNLEANWSGGGSGNRDVQKTRMKRGLKFRVNVLAFQFVIQKKCLHVLFEEKPKVGT